MAIKQSGITRILFVTLSNIGDVILTLPVLDYLREHFPKAKISVITGPRPKELFENNPAIDDLVIYDKRSKLRSKIRLLAGLKKVKFDLVVDLRRGIWRTLLSSRNRSLALSFGTPRHIKHARDLHIYRLSRILSVRSEAIAPATKSALNIAPSDKAYIDDFLKDNGIKKEDVIVALSPGARSHIKRWGRDKFVELIPHLIDELKAKIILVGDKEDVALNKYIAQNSQYPLSDLTAKTSLRQLAYLFLNSRLIITNDSANLHLASYLNRPVVAIFGPTDEKKYGPWSDQNVTVKKDISCRPCQKAQCRFGTLECMGIINTQDVLRQVRKVLTSHFGSIDNGKERSDFNRILVMRTDRIGDVLLSTPVLKALRERFPQSYIAMMVSPYAKDIVEGNPYIDKVIIYDKDFRHKNWFNSLKFSLYLKKMKFDLCLILHPSNRVHLLAFLAGIPKRVGYDRKFGFLLTDRLKHTKQFGEKHESEYALDLARYLGIEPKDKSLFMPLNPDSEEWAKELLEKEGIGLSDKILVIHPGASCISKIWPAKNFAEISDILIEKKGFKVLVVAGPKDRKIAQEVEKSMRNPVVNLAAKTSISQLASLLKRSSLFISNDSGPVHIAASLRVPVVAIFGRKQKGLGPLRWGPLGENNRVLHKDAGCRECLAHNCVKGFACLRALTPQDVLEAVYSLGI